jgi:hypothetical protein
MRNILLLLVLLGTSAANAQSVSIRPFESSLGFAPQAPRPVDAQHPLFGRILLEDVQGMPTRVGSFLMPITRASEFNAALRSTLASANMLARSPGEARARLRVTWRRFDLPFRIGLTSRASVAVRYELSRIDNGQLIYAREIVTEMRARGGAGDARARGTGRAAILANIASLTLCLERAPFEPPSDRCYARPTGRFAAPITVVTYR